MIRPQGSNLISRLSTKTAKNKCPYPQKIKVLLIEILYDLKLETATEGIKIFTQRKHPETYF